MERHRIFPVQRGESGITGLETAIILIAFVVVAAVFAYTTLSAGLFSTQKSAEAVYSGLERTQSTLEIRGGVIAYASSGTGSGADTVDRSNGTSNLSTSGSIVTRIQFTIANVLGGEPVNISAPWSLTTNGTVDPPTDIVAAGSDEHVMIISYDDANNSFSDCEWTRTWTGKNDGDALLEQDEKVSICVWLVEHNGTEFRLDPTGSTNGTFFSDDDDTNSRLIGTNQEFRLQVKSAEGATLAIERRTPGALDAAMDLH